MAIEEEFSIEIPDKEADAILSGMLRIKQVKIIADILQSIKLLHTLPLSQMLID